MFPGDHVVDVQSTHPYPSGGTVTGYAGCEVSKIVAIPETTAEVELESASYVLNRLSVMSQAPVTPKLSPPANLRVNGNLLPPVATREDVGLAPTISFLPRVGPRRGGTERCPRPAGAQTGRLGAQTVHHSVYSQ